MIEHIIFENFLVVFKLIHVEFSVVFVARDRLVVGDSSIVADWHVQGLRGNIDLPVDLESLVHLVLRHQHVLMDLNACLDHLQRVISLLDEVSLSLVLLLYDLSRHHLVEQLGPQLGDLLLFLQLVFWIMSLA